MKKLFFILRTSLSLQLAVLVGLGADLTANAQTVTVNNGALGLQTTVGATNDVWANPPPPNTVFDHWESSINILADPNAWHTTAVMPTNDATVTAVYKSAPAWTTTTYILNGLTAGDPNAVNLIYYFPPKPIGVIFFFHGQGANAAGLYSHVESLTFARDAVAAGYAIAALDSNDRTNKVWSGDPTSNNVDVLNVQAAINYFVGLGLMDSTTPKFATGMSFGGYFAPYAAYQLNFKGCAIWCAPGLTPPSSGLFTATTVPTIWALAKNDDLYMHPTFLNDAMTNLYNLTNRGVLAQLYELKPSPVYPGRLTRAPGVSAADAQTMHDRLRSGGYIDAQDYLVSDPQTNNWATNVLTTNTTNAAFDIEDQLDACYSGHILYSDYDDKILQFFNTTLNPTATDTPTLPPLAFLNMALLFLLIALPFLLKKVPQGLLSKIEK